MKYWKHALKVNPKAGVFLSLTANTAYKQGKFIATSLA